MSKTEYEELVKAGSRGEYPRILTTPDGLTMAQEFHDSYDQWSPNGTILCQIRNSDDWPTFNEATEMRREYRRNMTTD
jgi:hypothetical protein